MRHFSGAVLSRLVSALPLSVGQTPRSLDSSAPRNEKPAPEEPSLETCDPRIARRSGGDFGSGCADAPMRLRGPQPITRQVSQPYSTKVVVVLLFFMSTIRFLFKHMSSGPWSTKPWQMTFALEYIMRTILNQAMAGDSVVSLLLVVFLKGQPQLARQRVRGPARRSRWARAPRRAVGEALRRSVARFS